MSAETPPPSARADSENRCPVCDARIGGHERLCGECCESDCRTFVGMRREGRVLDNRYDLREFLGQGGMGQVWRAYDEWLGMEVAVKLLTRRSRVVEEAHEQLQIEYKAMTRIAHPGVVRVLSFGRAKLPDTEGGGEFETGYFTMELVPSPRVTLEEWIALGFRPAGEMARIALGLLESLSALADAGIVHGDVKPSNVFILDEPSGTRSLLADLGSCQLVGQPRKGMVTGSPPYMAIEVIDNILYGEIGSHSTATDVWSFAVVLYEMLTGDPLFTVDAESADAREAVASVRAQMNHERIGAAIQRARDIDVSLGELLAGCLDPFPESRMAPRAVMAKLTGGDTMRHFDRRARPRT